MYIGFTPIRSVVRQDLTVTDNRNPSLLIPLNRSADFLLVQSEYISVCKGVLAGPPETLKTSIPTQFLNTPQPGSNKGIPLWVQWDRAPRNPDFAKEAFYLAREDGIVLYMELGGVANPLEISDAGAWPCPIDTAFACLKADSSEFAQSFPDVLVAGGFGSDGHLCKVGAWPKEYASQMPYSETNAFGLIESLPNWAPITDMVVTQLENLPIPYDRTRASVFVSNGKAPYGEVSQLRQGIRAVVDETFSGLKGSTGLWVVDHGSTTVDQDGVLSTQDYATFVVSVPGETLVLRATRTQEEQSYRQEGLESARDGGVWETEQPHTDGLIRAAETISACPITEDLAVQITNHEIRVIQRSSLTPTDSSTFPNAVLAAATKPHIPYIVVAYYEGAQPILKAMFVSAEGMLKTSNDNACQQKLSGDPTCIDILVSDSVGPFIFVGTANLGFSLFKVTEQDSLVPVYCTTESSEPLSQLRHLYESVTLLTTHGQEKLVCGTRTGDLISIDIAEVEQMASTASGTLSITRQNLSLIPFSSATKVTFLHQDGINASVHYSKQNRQFNSICSLWLGYLPCPVIISPCRCTSRLLMAR